jgi:hypothetical protein
MEPDDMVMSFRVRAAFTVVFAAVIALAGTATAIADTAGAIAGATGSPTPTLVPERRDLYLDMPYHLGGFEPDIVMTRGAEHVANLDPSRTDDAATIADLEGLLTSTGAFIEDMTSGYALVSQDEIFAFVVAVRIHDAALGTLLPAYLPILLGNLVDASTAPATRAGKDVLIISADGANEEHVDLYVYDAGDTVWMIQGPDDVVEQVLEALPPPALPD